MRVNDLAIGASCLALVLTLVATPACRSAEATIPPPPQKTDQQAASPSAQGSPAETIPPPTVTVIEAVDAHGILGREVRSATDENMGRIVDVIVDRAGQPRAAVIDFGGFLGVGSRKIVVDWNALRFGGVASKSDSITLELTKDQVRAAPEYKEDTSIVVLGAAGRLEPWSFHPTKKPER